MRYDYFDFSGFGYAIFIVCVVSVRLYFKHGVQSKNIIFLLFGLLLLVYLAKLLLSNLFYEKFSILSVSKSCVVNNTTLKNDMCTVILKPNDKIIVMDNVYNANNSKRMFSMSKKDINVSKQWNKICKIFDNSSNLDYIASFCKLDTNLEIIPFDKKPVAKSPKVVPPQQKALSETEPFESVNKTVQEKLVEPEFDNKIDDNINNSNSALENYNEGRVVDF